MSKVSSVSEDELIASFSKFGINDKKSKEIIKNKKVSQSLHTILSGIGDKSESLDDKKLALLQQLAVELKGNDVKHLSLIVDGILDQTIKTNLQISEGLKYLTSHEDDVKVEDFNVASGIGQDVTEEQVKFEINKYLESINDELVDKRYSILSKVLGEIRKIPNLKWASPSLFKPIIDQLFLEKLGPKDERDVVKKEKKKPAAATNTTNSKATTTEAPVRTMFSEGFLGDLHKPGEQPQMYPELIKPHLEFTKGQVFTRFPPEPNGFLHIGHSKAIMVNFGYAAYHKGKCYLRFDDTNPEAEEEIYFESIKEIVHWLGFKPWQITYSSDYFQQLYDLAEQLIKNDKAYVCHCTADEVKIQRGLKPDGTLGGERKGCVHRSNQSIEENLAKFRDMKDGKYEIGAATLRMKQDYTNSNPQMWDLVAYRVLNKPHHRTGSTWKIYPTYDFTHCLVDSFENISHSLCTTEFRLSRESYEWLCDVLHVYRPAQREYGRLNITGTVLSKRKIAKLVNDHHVRGWDDPRLFTLAAIKRRGVPPGAILSFINTLGVTISESNIQVVRLESAIRNFLDHSTPRLFMLLDPIKIIIDNFDEIPEEGKTPVEIPYRNNCNQFNKSRKVSISSTLYIERNDFSNVIDDAEYFRLTPNQPVGLIKLPYTISVNKVNYNADKQIESINVKYNYGDSKIKPKTFIQWISNENKINIKEIRIYNQLFKSENPNQNPDGFLSDINPVSEQVITTGLIEKGGFDEIKALSPLNIEVPNNQFNIAEDGGKNTIRFQALRVGYFCVDKESGDNDDEVILNRIVTLKEDSAKK